MSTENPSPNPAPINATTSQAGRLDNLVRLIKEHHGRFQASIRTSLECARDAGLALSQAKEIVASGSWLEWLKKNCKLSPRQAQKYMQLAEGYAILEQNGMLAKPPMLGGAGRSAFFCISKADVADFERFSTYFARPHRTLQSNTVFYKS